MSLMEPRANKHTLFINPLFDKAQEWIWTADKETASRAWFVYFVDGARRHFAAAGNIEQF